MDKAWLNTYKSAGIPETVTLPADDTSLIDVFEKNFASFAGRDAFVCMGKRMSYQQLDTYSRHFAAYLQSMGLAQGSRVAVMLPNLLQYPVAALGILRAGMVLVNVNPLYTTRELEHQLKDSGAEVLIILDKFATVFQHITGPTPVKQVLVTGVGDMLGFPKSLLVNSVLKYVRKEIPAYQIKGAKSFMAALSEGRSKSYQRPTMHLTDTAVLQYTGGTTGVSKGAELTHRNLVGNLMQVDSLFQTAFKVDGEQQTILCALPLYHIFAFMVCAMFGMYRGALNVLVPNPRDLPGLIKELDTYKPTFFPAVNTLFNALVNNEDFKKLDFSNLKLSMGGGMAVLPATAEKWQQITGRTIIEGYGLSETSPVATANLPSNPDFTATIGVPLPSTEVAILDDDGKPVAQGERGEISIRGPQVMKGYWNRPDETAKVMTTDGFFRTGDIGVMDEKGFFKIVDRKKDMILVSGFNVYPNEIEDVVTRHPKVLEAAAIGVADEKSGEVPKLFVVKKDPSLTEAELLHFTRENLTGYKQPRYIQFIDELPKSNVGKILRKDLPRDPR